VGDIEILVYFIIGDWIRFVFFFIWVCQNGGLVGWLGCGDGVAVWFCGNLHL
jgi:hypothetical protein